MSFRYPKGGFITAFYDPLKVPNAPTIGTATAGAPDSGQVSVTFTAPTNVGGSAITSYTAVSTPGGISASGASSPITVTGLTNGTSYTFTVWALNSYGPSPYSGASGSVTPAAPTALFAGFAFNSAQIDSTVFSTLGNATSFGTLSTARDNFGAGCSGTRAVFMAGRDFNGALNVIDYLSVSTGGTATDFGDMYTTLQANSVCSNSTIAVSGGNASKNNILAYITIATTGNSQDFGDLLVGYEACGSCGSPTRGLWGGGNGYINNINYITMATTGNALDFGDLAVARENVVGASNSIRGIFAAGKNPSSLNIIEYVTIASAGNTTDFGDLLSTYGDRPGGAANSTRALFACGKSNNVIQYITIASTGNAIDFGDTTITGDYLAGTSNAHGGLA